MRSDDGLRRSCSILLRYLCEIASSSSRRTRDARSFKAHPFAFRASLIAPPKVFSFAAIATPLITLIRGSALPSAEFVSRNPWFLTLADRRLGPKGLRSHYMYAGTGVTR